MDWKLITAALTLTTGAVTARLHPEIAHTLWFACLVCFFPWAIFAGVRVWRWVQAASDEFDVRAARKHRGDD